MTENTEDVDIALAVLGGPSVAGGTGEWRPEDGASSPPALPSATQGRPPGPYTGRTRFDNLFQSDNISSARASGGPEEKVTYFRDKLRHAEGQIARLREAWAIREGELDTLEALLAEERERGSGGSARLAALERFLADKKQEFDDYAKKVTEAFAAKEKDQEQLQEQLRNLKAEIAEKEKAFRSSVLGYEDELARRDTRVQQLLEALKEARGGLDEREQRFEAVNARFFEAAEELSTVRGQETALRAQIETHERTISALRTSLSLAQDEVAIAKESVARLESELAQVRAGAASSKAAPPVAVAGRIEEARAQLKELQRVMRPLVLVPSVSDAARAPVIEAYGRVSRVLKELAAELSSDL